MPTQQTPQRSIREIVMMPVVYRVAGMDKVKVKSDLKYTDVTNPNLLMDVYSPPNLAKGKKTSGGNFYSRQRGSRSRTKELGLLYFVGQTRRCVGFNRGKFYTSFDRTENLARRCSKRPCGGN